MGTCLFLILRILRIFIIIRRRVQGIADKCHNYVVEFVGGLKEKT
jgi:hypothetical protein